MIENLFIIAPIGDGWRIIPYKQENIREFTEAQVEPDEWICLDELWDRESSWRTKQRPHLAVNRSSGAYGIPQALPAKKMKSAGDDWKYNPKTQVRWGLNYIKERYGSACKALLHHDKRGWY
jgi:hypothetical protein